MATETLTVQCFRCANVITVVVESFGYAAWKAGTYIQDALPRLSADERELLISRVCGPCFDSMFPEDGDE